MSEAVEFEVPDPGTPSLNGQDGEGVTSGPDPFADAATALMPVPGWTQQDAARVIGGLVAGLTTAMYVVRYKAAPAAELVPYIAGHPEQEFPLLGMSLAPILDLIAPKGSAAAVGVGLGAGISEVMGAMARRMPVLATPPPKARPGAAAAPDTAAPAAPSEGRGFRFRAEDLHVLRQDEQPLAGLGIE